MKTLIFCIGFGFVATIMFAQTSKTRSVSGIYMSWKDYKEGNLLPAEKIHLNQFLANRCIDIVNNGIKKRYCKDSIFGYQDKKHRVFRFFKSYEDAYEILENRELVIYLLYIPLHNSKGLSPNQQPVYYFSKSLSSKIEPLTIYNLKLAFPDNHEFHHYLDDVFGYGTPLSTYDNENKTYKVNYILSKSLNK